MLTIVETEVFSELWRDYWSEEEFGEFCHWLATHSDAGQVVRNSGGCRKVRWSRSGMGKSSGVRVIYFNRRASGEIWLLTLYAKSHRGNLPGLILRKLREIIDAKTQRKGTSEARR